MPIRAFETHGLRERVSGLVGRTFTAFHLDAGYWHLEARLREAAGGMVAFFTHEENAGRRFDVFTIDFAPRDGADLEWQPLGSPFQVQTVECLWRDEWIEVLSSVSRATPQPRGDGAPPLPNGLVGDDPHAIHSGPPGAAPAGAVSAARVLAGLVLRGQGSLLAVAASDRAPFNVELFQGPDAEALLAEFGATPNALG